MTGSEYPVEDLTDEITHIGEVDDLPQNHAMHRLIELLHRDQTTLYVPSTAPLPNWAEDAIESDREECPECGAPTRLGWVDGTRVCVLGHRWQVGEGQ